MADKSKFEQMAWFKRAIDKSIATTEANETIRTTSFEQDGVIYLVPTINFALEKGDFLTGFKNEKRS